MDSRRVTILFALLLLGACTTSATPTQIPTFTPVPTEPAPTFTPIPTVPIPTVPSPTPPDADTGTNLVSVRITEAATARVMAEVDAGGVAEVHITFDPQNYRVLTSEKGGTNSTSQRPWKDHNVAKMVLCTSLDRPCAPGDQWTPFVEEKLIKVEVDWLGPKEFWLIAEFRDTDGEVVSTLTRSSADPGTVAQVPFTIVGLLAETTDVDALPPPVQTFVAATRTAFPVAGSVEIEGGGCCAGGTAGEMIKVDVAFDATSPFGAVTEMRTLGAGRCFVEGEMGRAEWEPFASDKAFPVRVVINWVGYYVTVQFRDEQGNLSPAYCDDIGVEGHPPKSTPSPAP